MLIIAVYALGLIDFFFTHPWRRQLNVVDLKMSSDHSTANKWYCYVPDFVVSCLCLDGVFKISFIRSIIFHRNIFNWLDTLRLVIIYVFFWRFKRVLIEQRQI